MSQKRARRKKHELSGVKVTLDLLYVKDEKTCWVCGEFVERYDASIDHGIARKYTGSLRKWDSWALVYLAHQVCNQLRGAPLPEPRVIRWSRLPEEDYAPLRRLAKRLSGYPHWDKQVPAQAMAFLAGASNKIPRL